MRGVEVYGQDRCVNVSKALKWLGKHIAEPYGDEFTVRTVKGVVYVPTVVVLVGNYKPRHICWSKRNVLKRDDYTCAYCGNYGNTIDHVKPKSQCNADGENPNTWENTVTACKRCNARKGGRTPEQAGMRFRSGYRPTRPVRNG